MNEKYKEFNLDTKNTKVENLSQLFFIRLMCLILSLKSNRYSFNQ